MGDDSLSNFARVNAYFFFSSSATAVICCNRNLPVAPRLLEAGVDVRFADLPAIEGIICMRLVPAVAQPP